MVFPRASLPEFGDGVVPPHGLIAIGSYPPLVTSLVTELAWLTVFRSRRDNALAHHNSEQICPPSTTIVDPVM